MSNNRLRYLICTAVLFSSTQSLAVFCRAAHYIHPTTATDIWLFGDIHIDVDPDFTLTYAQQKIVLDEAKKRDALIIAEDGHYHMPYAEITMEWLELFGFYACVTYSFLYKTGVLESYWVAHNLDDYLKHVCRVTGVALSAGVLVSVSHALKRYIDDKNNNELDIDFDEYIQKLKNIYSHSSSRLPYVEMTPLYDLVKKAQKRKIRAIEAECRVHSSFQETTRMWRLEYYAKRLVTGNQKKYPSTLKDYCSVSDATMRSLSSCSTCSQEIKEISTRLIEEYKNEYVTHEIYKLAQQHPYMLLASLGHHIAKENKGTDIKQIEAIIHVHNSKLFDAWLLHLVYNNMDKGPLFICAGDAHIKELIGTLERLGFKSQYEVGRDNCDILEQRNCFGLHKTKIHAADLDYVAVDLAKFFAHG